MPFYEYQCHSCQYYVEVMQKITDAPLKKCPSCGRMTLVKLISAPVFRLKGGGWYETDFKSDKEAKRNLAGGEREESKPVTAADASAANSPAKPAADAPAAKPTADASAAKPAASPASPARRRGKAPVRATARSAARTGAPKRAARRRPKR